MDDDKWDLWKPRLVELVKKVRELAVAAGIEQKYGTSALEKWRAIDGFWGNFPYQPKESWAPLFEQVSLKLFGYTQEEYLQLLSLPGHLLTEFGESNKIKTENDLPEVFPKSREEIVSQIEEVKVKCPKKTIKTLGQKLLKPGKEIDPDLINPHDIPGDSLSGFNQPVVPSNFVSNLPDDLREYGQALFDKYYIEIPEDLIDYQPPECIEYLDAGDQFRERYKLNVVNQRREALGLPLLSFPVQEYLPHVGDILNTLPVPDQEALISLSGKTKVSLNIFSYPIIHRIREGQLFTCINFLDKYVNVTRLLQYAHIAGYSRGKSAKDINSWFETKEGRLLMAAGSDRFQSGVLNPANGKVYNIGVRMGYRVRRRIIYEDCFDVDIHKGVYLHPRIAEYVAKWVSPEFGRLFNNEFSDAIREYYELPFIDEEPDPLYSTPALPTARQILFYWPRNKVPLDDQIKIAIGTASYINQLYMSGRNEVLFRVWSVPDTDRFMKQLYQHIPYRKIKGSLYTFGGPDAIAYLPQVLSLLDNLPHHLVDIWQTYLVEVDVLESLQEELNMYDNIQRAKYRAKYYRT